MVLGLVLAVRLLDDRLQARAQPICTSALLPARVGNEGKGQHACVSPSTGRDGDARRLALGELAPRTLQLDVEAAGVRLEAAVWVGERAPKGSA